VPTKNGPGQVSRRFALRNPDRSRSAPPSDISPPGSRATRFDLEVDWLLDLDVRDTGVKVFTTGDLLDALARLG
jgi:hypothetical protein